MAPRPSGSGSCTGPRSIMAAVHVALALALVTLTLLQSQHFDVGSGSPSRIPVQSYRATKPQSQPEPRTRRGAWNASKPLTSALGCGLVKPGITARELDLQQQRRSVLAWAGGQPEGGYLAACLAIKNQHHDLPEWLDWHSRLGVSKFYVIDDGSEPPLDDVLAPYVADGRVVHLMHPQQALGSLAAAVEAVRSATCHDADPKHAQLLAYSTCLHDYGARHQWMAYIDADEFLVPMDGSPDLPTVLRDYEQFGGVAVNHRTFGSNGHKLRQKDTLTAYTACTKRKDIKNRWVKTIANMAFTGRAHCHHSFYAPGRYAVLPNGSRVNGQRSDRIDYSRLALNHYVTKSLQDFEEKLKRGNGMSTKRPLKFFDLMREKTVQQCTTAADMVRQWKREGRWP